MKGNTAASGRDSERSMAFTHTTAPPVEVFYVVQSSGVGGERSHCLRSALYETRQQAETELARLRNEDAGGRYAIWKSATYIEPAEWLHRVVRSDGTFILPRLHGVEKLADA
jgi:hypothetical protein